MMTDTAKEFFTRLDPLPARAVALECAATCGVSHQVVLSLRQMRDGHSLSAKQWLALALTEDRRWDDVEA